MKNTIKIFLIGIIIFLSAPLSKAQSCEEDPNMMVYTLHHNITYISYSKEMDYFNLEGKSYVNSEPLPPVNNTFIYIGASPFTALAEIYRMVMIINERDTTYTPDRIMTYCLDESNKEYISIKYRDCNETTRFTKKDLIKADRHIRSLMKQVEHAKEDRD